jgi:membrane protease YdiL (CAAX protease family)
VPLAGAPYLEQHKPLNWSDFLRVGVATGLLAWLLITVCDVLFVEWIGKETMAKIETPTAFYGFLASFYGAFVEEVLLRLLFMALLCVPLKRFGNPGIWIAIWITAVVFGLGHLPGTARALGLASVYELSSRIVMRGIVLNSIAGVIFGWLYWKKGLEYAMLSHFMTDIGLHVVNAVVKL